MVSTARTRLDDGRWIDEVEYQIIMEAQASRTVERIEFELSREHGFASHDEFRIRERLAIRRACQKRYGVQAIEARTHSYSIKSFILALRAHRKRIADLNAEVTRIEETRPLNILQLAAAE